MEAIKTKYDRILLGLLAFMAIAIGAFVLLKALSFKSQFTPPGKPGKEAANLGETPTDIVTKAEEALKTKIERKAPVLNGKVVDLLVSTPVIKTADGQVIALLDPAASQLRPPIDNIWLYDNELDLTRDDIANNDDDGDGYTNLEEFEGKSNPRNRSEVPPFYTKLKYVECVKEPLALKFAVYNNGEIQLTRTEPKPNRSAFMKEGMVFEHDKRFKVVKVETREIATGAGSAPTPVLIIEDSEAKGAPNLEIPLYKTVERPKLSAKIVDELSKKEFILREGMEFEVPKMPGNKILVTKVAEDAATISFILPGKTARQEETLKIK